MQQQQQKTEPTEDELEKLIRGETMCDLFGLLSVLDSVLKGNEKPLRGLKYI